MTPAHDMTAHVKPQQGSTFEGQMTPMNIYGSIGLLAILAFLYWTLFLKDNEQQQPSKKYNRRGESQDSNEVSLQAFNKRN